MYRGDYKLVPGPVQVQAHSTGRYYQVYLNNHLQGSFWRDDNNSIDRAFDNWFIKKSKRKNNRITRLLNARQSTYYASDMDWYGADWRVKKR